MYLLTGCLLISLLLLCLLFHCRKKKICRLLQSMSATEKCDILRPLIEPFGYYYEPFSDIFSTTIDTPQRAFGYTALFDRYASQFHMILDCLPIYFDYDGRTWMIEFWKGQYGILLGCEVGIYKANALVASLQRKTALFQSAEDSEMLPMSIRLCRGETELCHLQQRHWWLTAFCMGAYSDPKDLTVEIGITFPNTDMLNSFTKALEEQSTIPYCVCDLSVQILFDACMSCALPPIQKIRNRFVQWENRMLCRLFLHVTKPFCLGIDRLLCLYYYLPFAFRRILEDKKRKNCCKKSCKMRRKFLRKPARP